MRLFVRTCLTAALGAAIISSAAPAWAQARLGSTFYPRPADGATHRFPSVAFDTTNNAYLVVWGVIPIGARFVSANGVPLGTPVQVNTSGADRQAAAVRVACGGEVNACLVAWIEENPSAVMGRLIRYSGGNVQFLTAPFVVNQNGAAKLTSSAPAVAYSSAGEFLVAWTEYGNSPDIKGQRVNVSGSRVGGEIPIAVSSLWEGFPSLTYNSAQNEYLVAYYFEAGSSNVGAQRVQPGTGGLIGGRNTLYGSVFDQYPEIAYNSVRNQFLAITWGFGGCGTCWMLHGQLADGSTQPIGGSLSLAAGGGGDGVGLAYNPFTNSYFAVYQSQMNDEVWGVPISSSGAPGSQFQVTVSGTSGSVQPRVAANPSSSTWLAAASNHYASIMGQMLSATGGGGSAPPPAPSSGCTSPQPASDWSCDSATGNWLPPGTSGTSGGGGGTSACPSTQPGSGWTCDASTGNWLPPGSTGSTGGTPSSSACTTAQPGSDWTCDAATGNWLPPGSTGSTGGTPSTSACTTVQPGSNWTCDSATGNWLPPGTSGGGTTTSACTTPQPGSDWTCDSATGNWLPGGTSTGGTSACSSIQPGSNWTCDASSGNWLPPTMTFSSTASCTTTQPASNWTCDAATGNWLPPR